MYNITLPSARAELNIKPVHTPFNPNNNPKSTEQEIGITHKNIAPLYGASLILSIIIYSFL